MSLSYDKSASLITYVTLRFATSDVNEQTFQEFDENFKIMNFKGNWSYSKSVTYISIILSSLSFSFKCQKGVKNKTPRRIEQYWNSRKASVRIKYGIKNSNNELLVDTTT